MHCNYAGKMPLLNCYKIFMMFVYILSTHVILLCTRFDICSSDKVNSGEMYPNRVVREKDRDLTQSYDKIPYTNRNVKRAK